MPGMRNGLKPALQIGLSLQTDADFLQAALPLLEGGHVDVLEYSFDTAWTPAGAPPWVDALVDEYAAADRLLGHGVHFSALTGADDGRQARWLELLGDECKRRPYRHITEHFGFMSAGSFHDCAPLPVPMTDAAVALGQARLRRLQEVSGRPVGLENLGFAFGLTDVMTQGAFLRRLLEPVGGFLLLDLHNLYCQSCNFRVPMSTLLDAYPVHLVRELHVSGGSWAAPMGEPFRRDTHDEPVPEDIFAFLPEALARCPGTEFVIFERMGGTLLSQGDQAQFREDFLRLRQVAGAAPRHDGWIPPPSLEPVPAVEYEDAPLYAFQCALLDLLATDLAPAAIHRRIMQDPVFQASPNCARDFDLRAIATAQELVRKWGRHAERNPAQWSFMQERPEGV